MDVTLDKLVAMGFPRKQARRAYGVVPKEMKKGPAATARVAAQLIIDGAVPERDSDDMLPKSHATPQPPQLKPQPRGMRIRGKVAKAKKHLRVGAVGLARQPSASMTPKSPIAATSQQAASCSPSWHAHQRRKPKHWPFEHMGSLQQAIDRHAEAGEEGVNALPARALHSVGPRDQEWLSASSLGTLGQLKKMTDALAETVGSTPAQVEKLKRIREKAKLCDATLSMCAPYPHPARPSFCRSLVVVPFVVVHVPATRLCRCLGKATTVQQAMYQQAVMDIPRMVPAQQQVRYEWKKTQVKHDWEIVGGFAALNNHELGALLSFAGTNPKPQFKNDRYGEKTMEYRRNQLHKVVKLLMQQEVRQEKLRRRESAKAEKQSAWLLQQATKSTSTPIVTWACKDRHCGHVGLGCPGWAKRHEATTGEFGDESWAVDFDPDQAATMHADALGTTAAAAAATAAAAGGGGGGGGSAAAAAAAAAAADNGEDGDDSGASDFNVHQAVGTYAESLPGNTGT
eukprot:COSAG02_NODE_645_length_18947_cov_517.858712_10_plen_513_part_00